VIQPSGKLATSEMPHPAAASTMRAATGLSASIVRFPGRSLLAAWATRALHDAAIAQ
jgi:hypothetical protein